LDLLRKNMDSFVPPSDHELHESCFVCKNELVRECPECVVNPKDECLVVWGECGHMCHLHCHLRLPQKTRAFCPMGSQPWQPIGLTRTVKMEQTPRKSDPLGVAWHNMPRSDAGVSKELLERMESFVPPADASHWCGICRNPRDTECVECQALGTNECLATYSECGHVFHLHCYQRWSKMRQGCPIDNKPWKTVGLTRCRVRDTKEAHAHDHNQACASSGQ
jgi:anaphase-promoting complex subunit 11